MAHPQNINKLLLLTISGAFLFLTAKAQDENFNVKLLKSIPNCENVAFNSSQLISQYFNKNDFDSITYVTNRWEEMCGVSEPVFRIELLSKIQLNIFSDTTYPRNEIMGMIFGYTDRVELSKKKNYHQIYEYYKISLGYIPFHSEFDQTTVVWAESLLQRDNLSPSEKAFCLLYSNRFDDFWNYMSRGDIKDTKLGKAYSHEVEKTKKMVEGDIGILSGIFMPQSDLNKTIGAKPIFGFLIGAKFNKMQYDLCLAFRPGKPKQPYDVFFKDEIVETNYQFGGYIGLDGAYELSNNYKSEIDLLGGVGADIMDVIEGDPNVGNDSKTLASLNLNIGIGYRLYSKNMNYVGFQTKYNFVNFTNKKGTNLKGDYFSLVLTYNFFGNIIKHNALKKMHLK